MRRVWVAAYCSCSTLEDFREDLEQVLRKISRWSVKPKRLRIVFAVHSNQDPESRRPLLAGWRQFRAGWAGTEEASPDMFVKWVSQEILREQVQRLELLWICCGLNSRSGATQSVQHWMELPRKYGRPADSFSQMWLITSARNFSVGDVYEPLWQNRLLTGTWNAKGLLSVGRGVWATGQLDGTGLQMDTWIHRTLSRSVLERVVVLQRGGRLHITPEEWNSVRQDITLHIREGLGIASWIQDETGVFSALMEVKARPPRNKRRRTRDRGEVLAIILASREWRSRVLQLTHSLLLEEYQR